MTISTLNTSVHVLKLCKNKKMFSEKKHKKLKNVKNLVTPLICQLNTF